MPLWGGRYNLVTPVRLAQLLKAKQLRSLAASLGTNTSGTKSSVAEGIFSALKKSRFVLPSCHRDRNGNRYPGSTIDSDVAIGGFDGPMRVLSVDMGIRNLAVCLLEVDQHRQHQKALMGGNDNYDNDDNNNNNGQDRNRNTITMIPRILAWQRMSILPRPSPGESQTQSSSRRTTIASTTTTFTTRLQKEAEAEEEADIPLSTNAATESVEEDCCCSIAQSESESETTPMTSVVESFSKSTFSCHAFNLATTLLNLAGPNAQPHQVLIETQRSRSHGGAAVLEWTLRVNMLESMLWACLRTMAQLGYWVEAAKTLHSTNTYGSLPALMGSGNVNDGREGEKKDKAEKKEGGADFIEGVNPAKVVTFWNCLADNGEEVHADVKLRDVYWEGKKNKMRIVTGLLHLESFSLDTPPASSSLSSLLPPPPFHLTTQEAKSTANLFISTTKIKQTPIKRKRISPTPASTRGKKQPKGKLDDLADCLLQGLAWVKWEEARRRILAGEGSVGGVDVYKFLERVEDIERRKRKKEEDSVGKREKGTVPTKARGRKKKRVDEEALLSQKKTMTAKKRRGRPKKDAIDELIQRGADVVQKDTVSIGKTESQSNLSPAPSGKHLKKFLNLCGETTSQQDSLEKRSGKSSSSEISDNTIADHIVSGSKRRLKTSTHVATTMTRRTRIKKGVEDMSLVEEKERQKEEKDDVTDDERQKEEVKPEIGKGAECESATATATIAVLATEQLPEIDTLIVSTKKAKLKLKLNSKEPRKPSSSSQEKRKNHLLNLEPSPLPPHQQQQDTNGPTQLLKQAQI